MKQNFIRTSIKRGVSSSITSRTMDGRFQDFYKDLSNGWQQKAQRLQERRWRMIRYQ